MFDAHCHLHDHRVVGRADELVARARAAGVTGLLLAGVEADGWPVEERLAAAHPGFVHVSYGLHPQVVAAWAAERGEAEARRRVDGELAALEARLSAGGAVCVGEIGLDAAEGRRPSLALQEEAFVAQLALARRHALPVALHVLDAQARALEVAARAGLPSAGGMVHSFSGSAEVARDWLALGLHLSFAGAVANPAARRPGRAAAAIPDERLLVETDAPFQTPAPLRVGDGPNEPANLPAIVEAVARHRGDTPARIARLTEENARRLLRLAPPR
jgi:TatD DNase family protein